MSRQHKTPTGDGSLAGSHVLGLVDERADTPRGENVELVGGVE